MSCHHNITPFRALRDARNKVSILSRWNFSHEESGPRCPHCAHSCEICSNELWNLNEEGHHEVDCPECGGKFTCVTSVTYTYSTDEQEDEDGDMLDR